MTPELDKKLCQTFSNLYADRNKSMQETAMCWGFQHKNGWFDIIWRLSEKLEKMILQLPEDQRALCKASTVKEKFGTLRFYMTTQTEEMDEAIGVAEKESEIICETCGKPGKLHGRSWFYTSCDEHKLSTNNGS